MTARVVFMGTPQLAVPVLDTLASRHDVARVITQPDRARGRSGRPQPPPVKVRAEELGLVVSQPTSHDELVDTLVGLGDLDLGVVVAYGRILRPETLAIPRHGFLNVHFSLLPRWRGAAPLARALMAGDPMTGVSIMRLDPGLDTGPILTAQAIDIMPNENAGQLGERLSTMGAHLLATVIEPYLSGDMAPVPQTDDGATYADKLTAEDRPIDLSRSPREVVDHIRGLAPEPGATLDIDGEPHQILEAVPTDAPIAPGEWSVVADAPVFGVAGGGVQISLIKPPGRRLQPGEAWARGRHSDRGTVA